MVAVNTMGNWKRRGCVEWTDSTDVCIEETDSGGGWVAERIERGQHNMPGAHALRICEFMCSVLGFEYCFCER